MKAVVRRILGVFLFLALGAAVGFASGSAAPGQVTPWMVLPFVLLLLAIAIAPFINRHWWERNYPLVAIALGLVTVVYYVAVLGNPVRMIHTAVDYASFIALIGSLFVIAGGIHIRIKGRSTPLANAILLAIGAVISNIVGTTGASMILIRPYLQVNKNRVRTYHVVFFIFIVSNMGGALTPIGDPPLFLGYLKGVPFFWVAEKLWLPWLIAISWVLGIFYAIDLVHFKRLPESAQHRIEAAEETGEVNGTQNLIFLVIVLVAVFITDPPFLREVLMVLSAAGSYFTTKRDIHRKNNFDFHPIKEVAVLFLGIFATMVPALDWLEHNAQSIGIQSAGQFYWATGVLSSFLDNAPTYLNFLSAQIGLFINENVVNQVQQLIQSHGVGFAHGPGEVASDIHDAYTTLLRFHYDLVASRNVPVDDISISYIIANHSVHLEAISIAAVFFGACTYIGNGPNFMVKSIAERNGVQCPSFFGYVAKFTVPILLPIFLFVWLLFFAA
jgi:Na+/H+ antiporter NhaD/arsenite permease-like protein